MSFFFRGFSLWVALTYVGVICVLERISTLSLFNQATDLVGLALCLILVSIAGLAIAYRTKHLLKAIWMTLAAWTFFIPVLMTWKSTHFTTDMGVDVSLGISSAAIVFLLITGALFVLGVMFDNVLEVRRPRQLGRIAQA